MAFHRENARRLTSLTAQQRRIESKIAIRCYTTGLHHSTFVSLFEEIHNNVDESMAESLVIIFHPETAEFPQ